MEWGMVSGNMKRGVKVGLNSLSSLTPCFTNNQIREGQETDEPLKCRGISKPHPNLAIIL